MGTSAMDSSQQPIPIDQTAPRSEPPSQSQKAAEFRQRLVDRYGCAGRLNFCGRLRLVVKRSIWIAVIGGAQTFKRLIDIIGSVALLIALSPLFALLALLIRMDSPGPVLFKQTRIGKWANPFQMYKFRSMYVDAEARKVALGASNEMKGGVIFKMKHDPRITRVGGCIRKASIDELPQLWNVFRGDMSLVGPRPPVPSEVSQYTLSDRRRLEVKPGITCIWQVSGRSDIPFDQQVELDAAYIESQSVWMDIKLLLKTIPAVLLGRGAY
jgi:exopolysaccharide biosynthesis polyprenyl glycosylphosphotransferase